MNAATARIWAVCLGLATICVACDWELKDQVSHSRYANYAEAVQADAIAKGWVPQFLPRTATNIMEWHNVETDRSRVEFSFDAKTDAEWLTVWFKPITDSRTKTLHRQVLRSRGATIESHGPFSFYELAKPIGERGYLAISHDKGRAQYWSHSD